MKRSFINDPAIHKLISSKALFICKSNKICRNALWGGKLFNDFSYEPNKAVIKATGGYSL